MECNPSTENSHPGSLTSACDSARGFNSRITDIIRSRPNVYVPPTFYQLNPNLHFLEAVAAILQDSANAISTKVTVASKLKPFFKFCDDVSLNRLPPSGHQMVCYAAYLVATGTCTTEGSLRQYLSVVKTMCAKQNLFCPSPSEYTPLGETVRGMHRLFAGPVRRSKPITPMILTNLLNSNPPPNPSWLQQIILQTMKDASLLLFFTMLRSSNLMAPYPSAVNRDRLLTWSKIDRVDNGLVLTMIHEKTIQFRERLHCIPLASRPGSRFCPVAAIERLAAARGVLNLAPDDPVLMLPSGSDFSWQPMCKYQYNSWFKSRITQMKLDPSRYFIHGYRHGGVSLALLVEENITLVRLTSNHLSAAIMTYSQISPDKRFRVSSRMVDALESESQ